MKEITEKELNQLADIIHLFQAKKSNKQLQRFLNRLKALNKKYDTNELRKEVNNLIELLNIEESKSSALQSLESLLNINFDVSIIGNKVMGLYLPADRQIVPHPIPIHIINYSNFYDSKPRILKVDFSGVEPEEIMHWQNLGFDEAVALPYEHREIKGINVLVVKPLLRSNSAAREHGFSPAVMIITPKTSQLWRLVEDSIKLEKSMLSQ